MCFSFYSTKYPGQVLFILDGRKSKKSKQKYLKFLGASIQSWYTLNAPSFHCQVKSHGNPEVNDTGKYTTLTMNLAREEKEGRITDK